MTFDITTFGEALLRLSVPQGIRLQTATQLDLVPAGAESNIAYLMARLGRRVAWHSALPNNPLGYLIGDHLRKAGVNLDSVIWQNGGRVGTFYVEFAVPPRATEVIYDRANSCITEITPEMLRLDALLDTRLVHLTGITPALSLSCAASMQTIIARAKAAGVPISFDINYRQKLWSEATAKAWLTPAIQGVDLLLCGQADARRVFGIDGTPQAMIEALADISHAKQIVISLGDQGAIGWDGSSYFEQSAMPVQVIDRIGAGDALACGVIHGWLDRDLNKGLRWGVMLAALALSQHGDALITTTDEVTALLATTHRIGTVQR